jgi:lipoprotein NlpI
MNQKGVKKRPGAGVQAGASVKAKLQNGGSRNIFQRQVFLLPVILAVTFLTLLPTLQNDFIPTWDDHEYITENLMIRSLSVENIRQMFTTQVGGTYVPIPLLTYAVEYQLWGLSPVGFHGTNLLIHLICTFLLFRILILLGIRPVFAAAAALIYGVHPMGVESVSWVTERKDLMYCVFYFSSFLTYLYYIKTSSRRTLYYILTLVFFILALFSKIQAVSLPLVMLLADYYFKRKGLVKLVAEKIPHFALSLVFGVAGILVLKNVGALKINEIFTFTERFFFGIYSLNAYLIKFIAPVSLSAIYPYPGPSGTPLPMTFYLSPLLVIILGIIVFLFSRKNRAVVLGILFFLLSILFMLQIFGAGQGFMADRYVKVPYLGLVFILGWGMEYISDNYKKSITLTWMVYGVFLVFLVITAHERTKVWKNGDTLWSDVIEKFPYRDSRPYSCRGLYFRAEKDNDRALVDLNRSLMVRKDDHEIMLFRGNIYFDKGMDDSAYADYTRVLKVKMDDALALSNLGAIYIRRNQLDSALICFTTSIGMDSTNAFSYANRAVAYSMVGSAEESVNDFKKYLSLYPEDEKVCTSIALSYQKMERYPESLEYFDRAIALKPDFGSYYFYRSQVQKALGNRERALADGLRAIDLGVQVPAEYMKSLQ